MRKTVVNMKEGSELLLYSILAQYLLTTAKYTEKIYSIEQTLPEPLEGYTL